MDNAATTRVRDEVRDIMVKVMQEDYGNPSSKHTKGMEAEEYIDKAREIIAGTLKCDRRNITFTSGGTEANNQALIGTALANERAGRHIVSTVIEHASVHDSILTLSAWYKNPVPFGPRNLCPLTDIRSIPSFFGLILSLPYA